MAASLRLPTIERWLRVIRPSSVLEAGCGVGGMAFRLSGRYDYRGYEPDATAYEVAARRLAALGRGEVRNEAVPPDPDRRFDLLVAFEVLEHIEDDRAALRSWVRWLNPSGHAMVSVPAHPHRFGPADRLVGHYRRYRRDQLAQLLGSVGFDPIIIEAWGMPLGYALEAARHLLAGRRCRGAAVGTPGSGRLFQPPDHLRRTIELGMRPFAALQQLFRNTDLGIGYLALGRLAAPGKVASGV